MSEHLKRIKSDMNALVEEWIATGFLSEGDLFVLGCSTSEVAGEHIGTAGSEKVAAVIYEGLTRLKKATGIHLAFQCCEHLNRALVMESVTQKSARYEAVTVIPTPTAGGSMASFAYKQMKDPVVVEEIQANAGMDVGETLIGMHLKAVAVPVRFEQNMLGSARVILARTRPKLIGGNRAQYD